MKLVLLLKDGGLFLMVHIQFEPEMSNQMFASFSKNKVQKKHFLVKLVKSKLNYFRLNYGWMFLMLHIWFEPEMPNRMFASFSKN
jgi:hypothetical protein